MTTIANTDAFTVTAIRGGIVISRNSDNATFTIKEAGIRRAFEKHVASHDGQVNRVCGVYIDGLVADLVEA